MRNQLKILIIEDEPDIRELLKLQLELKLYKVDAASNYAEAKNLFDSNHYDLFLIDRMLPDSSGLDICTYLRNHKAYKESPIILITAMAEPSNIIEGLDAGADDYITKPFDINILHARVRSQFRQKTKSTTNTDQTFGELAINKEKCEVKHQGNILNLTNTEFQILTHLADSPGIVHSREKLIKTILGTEVHVTNRTIDTHIAGLRKKLTTASNLIETIRGVGYRLRENE